MILTERFFAAVVASSVSAILAATGKPSRLRRFLRAIQIGRVEQAIVLDDGARNPMQFAIANIATAT
jgi:hypothetical protein